MTIPAAHRTALDKHNQPDARPVDGAEAFQRMNPAFAHTPLNLFVEGPRNDFVLLRLRQLVEVDRITADAHGQLRIFFRMRLSVQQRFPVENVDVQMMSALFGITVQK